jgi:hypothetical protein
VESPELPLRQQRNDPLPGAGGPPPYTGPPASPRASYGPPSSSTEHQERHRDGAAARPARTRRRRDFWSLGYGGQAASTPGDASHRGGLFPRSPSAFICVICGANSALRSLPSALVRSVFSVLLPRCRCRCRCPCRNRPYHAAPCRSCVTWSRMPSETAQMSFSVSVKLRRCGRPTACNMVFLSRPGASPAVRDYPGLVCVGPSGL